VTFAVAVPLTVGVGGRAPLILLVGFGALLIAALPWLAYRRLVAARLHALGEPGSAEPGRPKDAR
jgi:hypothetical protein